jgi:O-acetyl-ADP-ribose deacetylase
MTKIEIQHADITKLAVDAVVNAANTSLLGGGGVDGAIHRKAGKELEFACRMLNGCKSGEAKLTPGFNLPAKYIIHTVGPVWQGGAKNEIEILRSCYNRCFDIAEENGFASIAFPAISTGIYGFPRTLAAEIAVSAAKKRSTVLSKITEVIFCCFDEETLLTYKQLIAEQK